jgi:hypothetical protein
MSRKSHDLYNKQETQRRAEIAIRAAFNMAPKSQSDMKLSNKQTNKSKKRAGKHGR